MIQEKGKPGSMFYQHLITVPKKKRKHFRTYRKFPNAFSNMMFNIPHKTEYMSNIIQNAEKKNQCAL